MGVVLEKGDILQREPGRPLLFFVFFLRNDAAERLILEEGTR
jgi:hypothetical protein